MPDATLLAIEIGEGQFVNATARWSKDGRTGVEFAAPIDLAMLRSAQRAMAG